MIGETPAVGKQLLLQKNQAYGKCKSATNGSQKLTYMPVKF